MDVNGLSLRVEILGGGNRSEAVEHESCERQLGLESTGKISQITALPADRAPHRAG
jgi:hypothetical protein